MLADQAPALTHTATSSSGASPTAALAIAPLLLLSLDLLHLPSPHTHHHHTKTVMTATSISALNLPSTASPFTKDRPLDGPTPAKFAIFHTATLTPEAVLDLQDCVNSSTSGFEDSKLAPAPDFTNRSVREVYDHFLALREQDDTIQPFYFIVADRTDFINEGVLGVCLDCSQEGECDVGVARCSVDWAGDWGVQIAEGAAGFDEMKEHEEAVWGGDDEGGRDLGPEEKHAHEATKFGWEVGNGGIRDRTMFGWYSLVEKGNWNFFPLETLILER